MNATAQSIRLAQCRGEALHAVSQLGRIADSEALSAITELSAKHLLTAVELLVNRFVKSQVVELIRLASHTVDNDQAGTLLRERIASNQTETQENIAAQIAGIHGILVRTRAVIDQTLDKIKPYADLPSSAPLHVPDTYLRKGLETILDLTSPSNGVPTSELLLKTLLQGFLAARSSTALQADAASSQRQYCDRLCSRIQILKKALSEALDIVDWESSEYQGKPEHLSRLPQLRAILMDDLRAQMDISLFQETLVVDGKA